MSDLSIFVDESGRPGQGISRYYLVTFILHDQKDDAERT